MNAEQMLTRLTYVEKAITAKGHPMQDASTMKMAMLDLIEVMREMIRTAKPKTRKSTARKPKTRKA